MKPGTIICVNGILTNPADRHSWTDEAERIIEGTTDWKCRRFEQLCAPGQMWFVMDRLADELSEETLSSSKPVRIIAHSNGCEIVSIAIRKYGLRCESLWLVGAACDSDFVKNGFNVALQSRQVEHMIVWVSPRDSALGFWARVSKVLFGWMGAGFGTLGCDGPRNTSKLADQFMTVIHHNGEHSDLMRGDKLKGLITTVTGTDFGHIQDAAIRNTYS